MARNLHMTRNGNIAIAAAVASGIESGDIAVLGSAGLFGYALTDRVTTALLADYNKTLPQGLADGEASVELPGISTAVRLTADGTGLSAFVKAYWDATNKVVTATASGNTFIGWTLEAIAADAVGVVGLMGAGS